MRVLHLTSSRFFGGPERQMLGLAQAMQPHVGTVFASFSEDGLNRSFLDEVDRAGFAAIGLRHDTPRLLAARRELVDLIGRRAIDILICHGYKAGTVGWFAARKCHIPVIAVSRGWTRENWKVGVYERLDRFMLRRMDRVICVSRAQADKVRVAGVDPDRITVIHNSIFVERFADPDPGYRDRLLEYFPAERRKDVTFIVGAAGRLSPEKGFDVLVDAAHHVFQKRDDVGFVLFGNGPQRDVLRQQIAELEMNDRFILAGFCDELDSFMPHFDIFAQSSHTEGLPNVLLESLAAEVPVVATDVGGTSEVLRDGECGKLVGPAVPIELANAICGLLENAEERNRITSAGKAWVDYEFAFDGQAAAYRSVLSDLKGQSENVIGNESGTLRNRSDDRVNLF